MVGAPKQPECVRNPWSKVGIIQMKVHGGKMYQANGTAHAETQRKERESWMLILELKAGQPDWRRV